MEESIIAARERRIEEAKQLTMFSDVFMTTALKDKAACQHILRILTGIKTLVVIDVRTQHRISNITSHDAIFDVLFRISAHPRGAYIRWELFPI